MGYNFSDNWSVPDFSALSETANRIREFTQPILESVQRFQEIMQPIIEAVERYKPQIEALSQVLSEAARQMSASRKLGDAQFVFWDYMTKEFIDDILDSNNINKTLREYLVRDKFESVNSTIAKCSSNPSMKKHLRLYGQAIEAFQNGQCDLSVTGLTSVFDGLLADISKNSTHSLPPRIKIIKDKLENSEILEHDEFATLTLALTFEKTLDTFSASSSFSKKEPKGLNRHWIAHGRSLRKKTKLDCVKMIHLIYGLLLIEELDAKESI